MTYTITKETRILLKMSITAQEAYTKSQAIYESNMDSIIEDFLRFIEKKIENTINSGGFDVSVVIEFYDSNSREKLSRVLSESGYKSSFRHEDYTGTDYIDISWRHCATS